MPKSNQPLGAEHHEAGVGRVRPERGGDPGEGEAADEGVRQGGGRQHRRVHVDVEADQRRPRQVWPPTQRLHTGE